MILVDSSVWIAHLRRSSTHLAELLRDGRVLCHPHVLGELACGALKRRREVLGLLGLLPRVVEASNEEVLVLVEEHRLFGRGLGWIDVHLLASGRLGDARLWTLDKRLAAAASMLDLAHYD